MKIKLTHELKVQLLEAIKEGELDTSVISCESYQIKNMTDEELNKELIRLYKFENRDYVLRKAELLRKYASGEIIGSQFDADMLALMKEYRY